MSLHSDAHKALELLEEYRRKLPPESVELREALARAIIAIRSRLFQALLGMFMISHVTLENEYRSVYCDRLYKILFLT